MDDKRDEVRQRHVDRTQTRFNRLKARDEQQEIRERHLGHGVAWGTTLGVALGAGLGVVLDNLAWGVGIGLCIGTGLGIALGAAQGDKRAKTAGESSPRSGAQAKDA